MRAFLSKYGVYLALPLLALPALWPYTHGWPLSADGFLHLLRVVLLDYHLQHGSAYPRWVPELVLGYGYPVFNFYAPATYYVAELFHILGAGYSQATMAMLGGAVIVGGYGMYLLAQDLLSPWPNRWAALVAAVAYMYAPYFLTNVFVRAAIGEVGAQALLPWIFWSFRRLLRGSRPAVWVWPAALSLGGLACTHNVTLIFLPPVLLAYMGLLWWQQGHTLRRLGWAVAAGLAAVGVSAFFWAPLIGERQYLADTAYKIASQLFIHENVWTWQNFLSPQFIFHYSGDIPFKLGLVQLILAAVGFVLAGRKDAEWWFLLVAVVFLGLGISQLSMPIWLSNQVLLAAQFPWRLLTLMTLPLALFTGGLVLRWRSVWGSRVLAVGLMGLIIFVQAPRYLQTNYLQIDNSLLTLPSIAQFEVETANLGTSSTREFMPRWVDDIGVQTTSEPTPRLELQMQSAGLYERNMVVSSPAGGTLRFTDFYYPGWQVRLDHQSVLPARPTTQAGLLTVDVPAGTHDVSVKWVGTHWLYWPTWLSLATLVGLTLFQASLRGRRGWAVLPGLLAAWGMWATWGASPTVAPVLPPAQPVRAGGLNLLGYRTEQTNRTSLYIYPYWLTTDRPTVQRARWQLRDAAGQLLSETVSRPYFNGLSFGDWTPSTVADDAYQIGLPPGLPAGEYQLWLGLETDGNGASQVLLPAAPVGTVKLAAVPPLHEPAISHATGFRFANQVALTGYDLAINDKPVGGNESLPVARSGDFIEYTLYWRALAPLTENYHGYLHLLDVNNVALVKHDQMPGPWFRAPSLWDVFRWQPDIYRFEIPQSAPSGLYWPHLALYHFKTVEQLPVQDAAGQALGDSISLPPMKVWQKAPPSSPPQTRVDFRWGEYAALRGYDLALPADGLHPGSEFTVTLYYACQTPLPADYTQFVHLYAPETNTVVAQKDEPPVSGLNPTHTWQKGEVIASPIKVSVSSSAAPGTYTLLVGLYDPAAEGARLPAADAQGQPLENDQIELVKLTIK